MTGCGNWLCFVGFGLEKVLFWWNEMRREKKTHWQQHHFFFFPLCQTQHHHSMPNCLREYIDALESIKYPLTTPGETQRASCAFCGGQGCRRVQKILLILERMGYTNVGVPITTDQGQFRDALLETLKTYLWNDEFDRFDPKCDRWVHEWFKKK